MKNFLVFLFTIAVVASARADQKISEVQQSLKDQGFYYGDVSGESTKETTDAVRRYQIRNGLTVSGVLDDQTLQAIRKSQAVEGAATTPAPEPEAPVSTMPQPKKEAADDHSSPVAQEEPAQPFNAGPATAPNPARPDAVYDGQPVPEKGDVFARTPYETAPPELQHRVIMDGQRTLAQKGLYKFPVDGIFSPNLEFALRAYQARVGLRPTGRFDLETLAALELLPASHRSPVVRPRVLPSNLPPVRGEWIRP